MMDRRYWIVLLCLLVFGFGILSMGYQQVASRVLAPFFGSDYIVWSVLISTFLAAFTIGSFLGGWVSGLERVRRLRAVVVIGEVAVLVLGLGEWVRKPMLEFLDVQFESVIMALVLGCVALFAAPVITLSSVTPIAIELLARTGVASGKAAGRLYGISTVGNIVGVFVTALGLIPRVPMPQILVGWAVTAAVLFAIFALVASRSWSESLVG